VIFPTQQQGNDQPSQMLHQQNQDRARLIYDINVILGHMTLTGSTPLVVFTVPSQNTYVMKNFTVFNSSQDEGFTTVVRLVPPGGDINDSQWDYWESFIRARQQHGSYPYEEVLTAGYKIAAVAPDLKPGVFVLNVKINGASLVSQ
jgi:hypothetical protein